MERLIYHGYEYRILRANDDTLLKLSTIPEESWQRFVEKDLPNANTPLSFRNVNANDTEMFGKCQNPFVKYRTVITLPFLPKYKTLSDTIFPSTYTTKDILRICRNNLQILKQIHEKDVCHCDIIPSNIMINKTDEIEFIDFDACIIDDYISEENIIGRIGEDKKQIFAEAVMEDKEALFSLYLNYLANGTFSDNPTIDYKKLCFNQATKRIFQNTLAKDSIPRDYYYDDLIEHLASTGYESPIVYSKNITSKYGF